MWIYCKVHPLCWKLIFKSFFFPPLEAQIWEGSCFTPRLLCHIYNCGASLLFHCLSGGCENAKSICMESVCFCTPVPF